MAIFSKGCEIIKDYCPFRICPIGAIDHQSGMVVGAAINLGITIEYEKTNDSQILIKSEMHSIEFKGDIHSDEIHFQCWYAYLEGVICFLNEKYDLKFGISGTIISDWPSGGISSSAAIQIAFAKALTKVNNILLNANELISMVCYVEKELLNINIGYLDPYAIICSKKDSMMFLDTKTNYYKIIKNTSFNEKYQFLLVFSGYDRKLMFSNYNNKIKECEQAVKKISNTIEFNKMRDVPQYIFFRNKYKLDDISYRKFVHFYDEMSRVASGLKAWRENDITTFGKLMNASCESSIYNYGSGSDPLIDLHHVMISIDGVIGSRFLGAGINGSLIAIIERNKKDVIVKNISTKYLQKYPSMKDKFKTCFVSIENGVEL